MQIHVQENGDGKPVVSEAGVTSQLLDRLLADMSTSGNAATSEYAPPAVS